MGSKPSKKSLLQYALITAALSQATAHAETQNLAVFYGFVTKVRCEGRVLASAIGNDQLVQLEPMPQAIGCGVVLKPVSKSGSTNLILETSAGTVHRTITITDPQGRVPKAADLMISVRAQE